ncbi:ATP-dependent DNA helicase UvrD2 [Brevibacterium album]|uniref:ATP-dependent DNA helicase UvrD2 n=1 Tax=Brevibacterium album TaxID=417948 RepID=UPI00042205D3|nr:ATP-dependent DNA helicase UvrD2 [Brevibacterium album]
MSRGDPGRARPEQLLDALDPEQRQVAEHLEGPLVVLAGAGTGKTRAMTHRIAYGAATGALDPRHVLALTFTAKAAGEMRSRLRALGAGTVQARTFHSAALRQLRYFWPRFGEGPFPELMAQKAPMVSRAVQAVGIAPERETVRDVAAEIEYAAVSLLGAEEYGERAGGRDLPAGLDAETMVRVIARYGEIKTERRILDFEDVLLVLAGVLGSREEIAAEVHGQYRSFVVDEFQDVSPLQYDLLRRWLGRRDSLCVVGDPAQTIYTFAGASDRFLRRLPVDFPGAREIRLVRNYRSAEPVIGVANAVLARTARSPIRLRGTDRTGPQPAFAEYEDDAAEAEAVAARIASEVSGGRRAGDIAVLFRTNSQSRLFEEALSARGVPYVLRGGERFFARREVKEAIAIMRAASGRGSTERLDEQVRSILSSVGWTPEAPSAQGAVRERWESLTALVNLAQDSQADTTLPVPLSAFIAELDDRAEHQFAPAVDGVTLASVHAAKGLEWESVHLVGASEGLIPIGYAETADEIDEERRLFYVAVTRARTALSLSWSKGRRGASGSGRRASRFVSEVQAGQRAATTRAAAPAARNRTPAPVKCRVCGRLLTARADRNRGRCGTCPAEVDDAVLEAVVHWRAAKAEEARLPVFLVLAMPTVREIAEKRPEGLDELGRVSGIGPLKLEQYGAELLELVRAHRSD